MAESAQEAAGAAEAATRLFGEGAEQTPVTEHPAMPEGYIEKYWQAAKGDAAEYAKHLSQGYTHLNGQYTQVTQQMGEDKPGETAELYWAEQTPEQWSEQYAKLDFSDVDAIRDIYRAAHAQGIGVKAAQGLVAKYLESRNTAAPEVETDEARRSRVIHELGVQGAQTAAAVAQWVGAKARSGELTTAEVEALLPLADSADGMRALFKMSRSSLGPPPAGTAETKSGLEAAREQERDEIRKGLADPEKLADPAFVARYRAFVKDGHLLDGSAVPVAS